MVKTHDSIQPLFWADLHNIYSISFIDGTIKRTENVSKNGLIEIVSINSEDNIRLTLKCTKADRCFLQEVNLNEILLNEFNNKIELKEIKSKAKLYYAIETEDDTKELILDTLINLGVKFEKDFKENQVNVDDLCIKLADAIRNGDQNGASRIAIELASQKIKLIIAKEKENGYQNGIDRSKNGEEVIEIEKEHEDSQMDDINDVIFISNNDDNDALFDINCYLIHDSKENKAIFLEDLSRNMTIKELKQKLLNEYKIPIENQYIIINNVDTNDDERLITYFDGNDSNKQCINLLNIQETKENDEYLGLDTSDIDMIEENIDGWNCSTCTVRNKPYSKTCEVCDTKRPENYAATNEKYTRIENFNNYVSLNTMQINENTEPFNCDICLENDLGPCEGVILKGCLHIFCKGCLRDHINHYQDASIKCPFNKDYICQSELEDREVRALVSEEEYEKVQQRGLRQVEAQAENTFHCKTPDCKGFCIYDEGVCYFLCPVCDQTNCIKCQVIHMGKTCDEYKEDLKLKEKNDKLAMQDEKAIEEMIKRNEAMRCPGCKAICLKDAGCDWCQCFICKMEICWATKGPRWGKGGRGDNSGGCGCNFMNKKCHPKCQNCH